MTEPTDVARPPAGHPKVRPAHLGRVAVVYVRQSTPGPTERNIESADRQYALVERAVELGWSRRAVEVIDEDLGVSGAAGAARSGFAQLTADIALGRVGIVFGLEVSRLARSNADWYRLLDLAGITDTLIADADGIYHQAAFNDRLVLGLKGTMSEAELHVLRARLEGGIRNKAARGELRRGLPAGLVWGDEDGEIGLHPDEAVRGVIGAIFERFAELGSVRAVWLWLLGEGLLMPVQRAGDNEMSWITPTYPAVHRVLTHLPTLASMCMAAPDASAASTTTAECTAGPACWATRRATNVSIRGCIWPLRQGFMTDAEPGLPVNLRDRASWSRSNEETSLDRFMARRPRTPGRGLAPRRGEGLKRWLCSL